MKKKKRTIQEQSIKRNSNRVPDQKYVDLETGMIIDKPLDFDPDSLNKFDDLPMVDDETVPSVPQTNPFTIWYINTNTGECVEALVGDGYICQYPNGNYTVNSAFSGGMDVENNIFAIVEASNNNLLQNFPGGTHGCIGNDEPGCTSNTWQCFQNWLSNNYSFFGGLNTQSPVTNLLSTGYNNAIVSDDCPGCLETAVQAAVTAGGTLPTANGGVNLALIQAGSPPAGLTFSNDGSCEFPGCGIDFTDNHFCTEFSGICNGYTPTSGLWTGVDGTVDCTYTGCTAVRIDSNYICMLHPFLCGETSPSHTGNPVSSITGTDALLPNASNNLLTQQNDNVCMPVLGCTNSL